MTHSTTRWALLLEYDGGPFVGWQRQSNGLSIQQVLEQAAAHLNAGQPVASVVAGRTDAGVHAEGQVAHIDLPDSHSAGAIRDALNFYMKPHPVVVLDAVAVAPDWSARFAADRRSYRFRILNRRSRPGLMAGRVWHVPAPLDATAMHQAAQRLLGRHDFTSFRAASCQAASPIRTLERLDVTRHGDIVEITAEARSFLHHQVRNLAGTLKLVGEARWPVERVSQALAARDRAAAGPTAPPEGLALISVGYKDSSFHATPAAIRTPSSAPAKPA
ncbi:tRNA pseudouridine(38-40) synthase TruA [Rhodopila sp.]|uniref:tRNA pseudouridine(38-40) synthase TruA n=1 Tax=Rhodopila sp. TaxID=2480087 RepID=UPI003D150B6B